MYMYARDKQMLLEDFCSYAIDKGDEKITLDTIDSFVADLKDGIPQPYILALFDCYEIEHYLKKVFIDLKIVDDTFTY